jgi:hypothetical protein
MCWTLTLSIGGILSGQMKHILVAFAASLLPVPALLALAGDFSDALILFVAAAVGCGIALKHRQSVGATFALTTMGSASVLFACYAIFSAATGQPGHCFMGLLLCAMVPLLITDGTFRRRINGELPRRVVADSEESDHGSCNFGESGSGFGRSGSGF